MSAATWFAYFVGAWTSVYLTDTALRMHPYTKQWYQDFTTRFGISFNFLQARCSTQRFNRLFHLICRFDFIPWRIWFSCGVIVSVAFMLISIFLLTLLVYNTLLQKPITGGTLTPVMPGVNLPFHHVGFYMLILLLCVILHEAGHALAAVRERVRIHGVGVFLFALYPGAYVDLNTVDLLSLKPFSQLRVYCAGVWHNVVIAALSILVFYAMPTLLSPAYHTGNGVGVTFLREDSVVTGPRGLSLGDAITRINSCPVTNQSDWYRCLEEAHWRPSGYCVSGLYLTTMDTSSRIPRSQSPGRSLAAIAVKSGDADNSSAQFVHAAVIHPGKRKGGLPNSSPDDVVVVDCCSHQSASTHLCFTYLQSAKYGSRLPRYACLPARPVTERAMCHSTSDCGSPGLLRVQPRGISGGANSGGSPGTDGVAAAAVARNWMCVVPNPPDNQTRLVRLVHNRNESPAILFLGPLDDLMASVGVSDYVPRWPNLIPSNLPTLISLCCTYSFSLSGALVILNTVPCYSLDGHWILKALIDLCLSGCIPCRRRRDLIFKSLLSLGTLLLGVNLCMALALTQLAVILAQYAHWMRLLHRRITNYQATRGDY